MTIPWRGHPTGAGTVVCAAIAVAAAAAFLAATAVTGQYSTVTRLGGAGWVFLLVMIILMPTLMPRVRGQLSGAPRATKQETTVATVRDPVCGMEIEVSRAAGNETHEGKEYFFCSKSCQERFRAEPQQYVDSR